MIDKIFLQKLAVKNETSYQNMAREYIQQLFLRSFYSKEESQNFLFKGGTALKIVFGSPRFSEDLDFTGSENGRNYEKVLEETLYDLANEGLSVDLAESKPTTDGHLANIVVDFFGQAIEIKNQVSFRKGERIGSENIVVAGDLVPAYNVFLLERSILVAEKIKALIERAKPRDFFDLYFILRKEELRRVLKIDREQRGKILEQIGGQEKERLKRELKELLPKSFWKVIDDLPSSLIPLLAVGLPGEAQGAV